MNTVDDRPSLVALFTDFGSNGPYLGQMTAVLHGAGSGVPVVNLLSDAPRCDPRASAYLLAALADPMPAATLFLSVVDPGVGGERAALLVRTEKGWFIGPDNGLFSQVVRQAPEPRLFRIDWRPPQLSDSFHGRDLFAPVAAAICSGRGVETTRLSPAVMVGSDWPAQLWQVIYIDHYGNAFTGVRGASLQRDQMLDVGAARLNYARTFCSVPRGSAFWTVNSQGLVEISVNGGRADQQLRLAPGSVVSRC